MEFIVLYLIFAMFATMWLDATRYTIPNWLVGSLLILYPVAMHLSPHAVDWKMALAALGVVFAVGYIVYTLRWMGGGDVKLIAVLALWVGWGPRLLEFIFMFGILGGILSIVLIVIRRIEPFLPWKKRFKTPRIFEKNGPVPYGIAIAAAFLWMMSENKIPLL